MFGWFLTAILSIIILVSIFSKKPYVKITGTGIIYTFCVFCAIVYAIVANYLWFLIMGLIALTWYYDLKKYEKKYDLTWIESFKTFLRKGP